MRPIRLEMQAFGSFHQKAVLPMQELNGLWLICGDTGAGKTTLFDAMVYALYGDTPTRSGRNLRSDYAEPDEETYVDFTFALGEETYRVRRSPEYTRRKTRGEGETRQAARAQLWQGNRPLNEKTNEVTGRVIQLLGVDYDQFCQLALIAQGRFREILSADTARRSLLFGDLFHTRVYARFQELLADKRKACEQEREAMRRALRDCAERFLPDEQARADARFLAAQGKDATPGRDLAALMNEQVQRQETQLQSLLDREAPLEKESALCQQRLGAAEQLQKRREEWTRLCEAIRQDEAEAGTWQARQAACERINAAWGVKPAMDADTQAEKNAEQAKRLAVDAAERCKTAEKNLAAAGKAAEKLPEINGKQQRARAEADRLADMLPRCRELAEKRKALAEVQRGLEGAKEQAERAKARLLRQEERLQQLQELAESLPDKTRQLGESREARRQAEERANELEKLSRQQRKVTMEREEDAQLQHAAEDAQKLALASEQTRRALYDQYMAQQAGQLAQTLVEGQPCPVCGSVHHPAPRSLAGEAVSREQVDETEAAAKRDDAVWRRREQEWSAHHGALQELVRQFEDGRKRWQAEDDVQSALRSAQERYMAEKQAESAMETAVQQAKDASEQAEKARKEIAAQQQATQQLEQAVQAKAQEYAAKEAACKQQASELPETDIVALEARCNAAKQETDALNAQAQALEERLHQTEKVLAAEKARLDSALQAEKTAETKREEAKNTLRDGMQQAGFDGMEDCFACMPESLAALQKEQNALQKHRYDVRTRKEQEEKLRRELAQQAAQPVETLRKEAQEAAAALKSAQEATQEAKSGLNTNRRVCTELTEKLDAMAAQLEEAQLYTELAILANGQDAGTKLSFERYVQRFYFAQVVDRANLRLRRMTGGAFELRMENPRGGRGQQGLDLNVLDYQTGRERPASTLSGGESFLASLALALGLSDLVSEQASQVRLDALFIDEGFGTLDDAALQQAVDALALLSQHDSRLVGVISHRPEMRERIPQQVFVSKGEKGSSLQIKMP